MGYIYRSHPRSSKDLALEPVSENIRVSAAAEERVSNNDKKPSRNGSSHTTSRYDDVVQADCDVSVITNGAVIWPPKNRKKKEKDDGMLGKHTGVSRWRCTSTFAKRSAAKLPAQKGLGSPPQRAVASDESAVTILTSNTYYPKVRTIVQENSKGLRPPCPPRRLDHNITSVDFDDYAGLLPGTCGALEGFDPYYKAYHMPADPYRATLHDANRMADKSNETKSKKNITATSTNKKVHFDPCLPPLPIDIEEESLPSSQTHQEPWRLLQDWLQKHNVVATEEQARECCDDVEEILLPLILGRLAVAKQPPLPEVTIANNTTANGNGPLVVAPRRRHFSDRSPVVPRRVGTVLDEGDGLAELDEISSTTPPTNELATTVDPRAESPSSATRLATGDAFLNIGCNSRESGEIVAPSPTTTVENQVVVATTGFDSDPQVKTEESSDVTNARTTSIAADTTDALVGNTEQSVASDQSWEVLESEGTVRPSPWTAAPTTGLL